MKKSVLSILLLLLIPMVPTASYALTVTIDGQLPPNPGVSALQKNIAGNYVNQAGAIDLVIDKCPNCAGDPRVAMSLVNGVFQVALTDARIKFLDLNPHTILFHTDSGDFSAASDGGSLAAGTYPHFVKVNGSFQNRPPLGIPARNDKITIVGRGEGDVVGGAIFPTPDPAGTTSFVFTVVNSGSFATSPRVTENILCSSILVAGPVAPELVIDTCDPGLNGSIIVQATQVNDILLLPGSVDVGIVVSTPAPPTLLLLGFLLGGWALCVRRRA